MFILISLIVFFGIILFFGWNLARAILRENKIEILAPLAFILGCSAYSVLLNVTSYFIGIQINFYLILVVLAALAYLLFLRNKRQGSAEWGIDKKWRKILFVTCLLLMLPAGIFGVRTITEMEHLNHLPLAATIAEGNFPVKDVSDPDFYTPYHYGSSLLLAAIHKVTNLPLWLGYDLLNFIIVGIIFLLGFILIRVFCKDNFKSYLASLIMVLGGNLSFFYGIRDLVSLGRDYIQNLPIEAPYRFLSALFLDEGSVHAATLAIDNSRITWAGLGFALTLAVIYLYFKAINDKENWLKISLSACIPFLFLALSAEVFFGVLGMVLLVYPLVYAACKRGWSDSNSYLKSSLLMLLAGGIGAVLLGGTITHTARSLFLNYGYPIGGNFLITAKYILSGLMFTGIAGKNILIPIFSWNNFLGWGWLVIFILPVAIYWLKNFFREGLFFILLVFTSFLLPLILTAGAWQGDLSRTRFLTSLFWNLIFGFFLAWLFSFLKDKWQKSFTVILISVILSQGLLYLLLQSVFPNLKRDQPFVAKPLVADVEAGAFDWIRKRTTIEDHFLVIDETQSGTDYNSRFVALTGRFAPNFFNRYPERYSIALTPEATRYRDVLNECSSSAINALNYRYLYINESWPIGLEQKCLANNNIELKFEEVEGNRYARIYKILEQ